MDYLLHVLILMGIYVILAVSLNLVAGYLGLLSLAQAAFYGVGAYLAALFALKLQVPFPLIIVCIPLVGAVLGLAIGIPSLRVRDDYFVVATLAFQVITFGVLNNWVNVTGGPMGIQGIPAPTILGRSVSSHAGFLVLILLACIVTGVLVWLMVNSPFGRVLRAIREDEVFTQSLGKDVTRFKLAVFAVSAALASLAGTLYASYVGFIAPSGFTVTESIFLVTIVIFGGAGSFWGPIVGAVILIALPEVLRFVGLPNAIGANIRQIIYGLLLVVLMLWRPQGLLGKYAFEKGGSDS